MVFIKMEPPQSEKVRSLNQLNQVTPLSKYLALVLFILLPFVGGWIGYTLAPVVPAGIDAVVVEKQIDAVVQRGTSTTSLDVVVSNLKSEPESESQNSGFISVTPNRYVIPAGYFPVYDKELRNLYAYKAKKITDNLSLVQVASPDQPAGPVGTVLYDETVGRVVRVVTFPLNTMDLWITAYTRIVLEWDTEYVHRLVIYDYRDDVRVVLFQESEVGIQLAEVCEMGCRGMLSLTPDGEVAFGRYRTQPGTSLNELIETVSVPLPNRFQ